MQQQAVAAESLAEQPVLSTVAMLRVTNDGVRDMPQVTAYLVRAAGDRPYVHQRVPRCGVPGAWFRQFGGSQTRIQRSGLLQLSGFRFTQRKINLTGLSQVATHHGKISLLNLPLRECCAQSSSRLGREREDKDTRGGAVEAMNREDVPVDLVPDKLERKDMITGKTTSVNKQPVGLVDHNQVIVTVQYAQESHVATSIEATPQPAIPKGLWPARRAFDTAAIFRYTFPYRSKNMKATILTIALLATGLSCAEQREDKNMTDEPKDTPAEKLAKASFGMGCFWCSEAIFETLPGVVSVVSGYQGGTTVDPRYEQVCRGDTGHAEVIEVTFDPGKVSYAKLLELFWAGHDPTTPNRQGADVGTQYRSVIFCYGEDQLAAAKEAKAEREKSGFYAGPIVTEIATAPTFYPAEANHQDYYRNNSRAPYCRLVIEPKLRKLGKK